MGLKWAHMKVGKLAASLVQCLVELMARPKDNKMAAL